MNLQKLSTRALEARIRTLRVWQRQAGGWDRSRLAALRLETEDELYRRRRARDDRDEYRAAREAVLVEGA